MRGIGEEAVRRCDLFKCHPFSDEAGALTRRFLTPAHRAVIAQLSAWMRDAGMGVRLDPAGTLVGRYEGAGSGPALLIGSHIDTVRDAGAYDGMLGVMLGLGVIEHLHRTGQRFPFAIELLAFGDEEGSRFPASMLGSRALAGMTLDDPALTQDEAGMTLAEALRDFGLDPAAIAQAGRSRDEILLYFEPHIEQGPVLEAEGLAVGIVTGIAAQTRLSVEVLGEANHAGTTPMPLRRDALAAAAEAMLALEAIARRCNIVGTVGAVQAFPGLGNVVPGRASFTVDIRAPCAEVRDAAEEEFRDALAAICTARGVSAEVTLHQRLAPCFCDDEAQALLAESLRDLGLRPFWLASGAGHDAMSVATLVPVAMLFIRCAKGISHNPAEFVLAADVEIAAQVMLAFLTRLAARSRLSLG